jgi:hypothetical protein
MQKLEEGVLLPHADGVSYWTYGSIFMVTGDHPFLAAVGGAHHSW